MSSHEVAQGYKDVKERSVFVRFRLVDEENTSFLAWTTTPWTLPSNVALCMNAKEDYAKIKVGDEYFIMAKALIPSLFKEDEYELVSVKKGKDYEYTKYKPLFDYVKDTSYAFLFLKVLNFQGFFCYITEQTDRKSTRLNSSHAT